MEMKMERYARNPQAFTSARTSIRQVPMLHRKLAEALGPVNLDLGGGAYDDVTEFLAGYGVRNLIYDPYNRPPEHNTIVLRVVDRAGGADSVTVSNVLNVIDDLEARMDVIRMASEHRAEGAAAYFSVYEGTGKGIGRQTGGDQWQANRKTSSYLPEIKLFFEVIRLLRGSGGKIIIAE